jgi:hypothetical protein
MDAKNKVNWLGHSRTGQVLLIASLGTPPVELGRAQLRAIAEICE